MSRTRRKPKTGAKAVAHNCRNNGTCGYCKGNRLHKHKRKELVMSDEEQYTTIEVDIPDDEESHRAVVALGLRLAILQGIYDVTYTEIATCLEENFSHRKVNPD
tara:strand:- start:171 stop:482 length:312 start_codon:yes stop_codon:yes gene_type:complete